MKAKIRYLLDHIEEIVLVPGFAIMLIINFGNVLSRYVLPTSWAFTEELCVMMFVYVTFFGAAVAVKRRQHLGFNLILDKLPKGARIAVDTLIMLSIVCFLVVMIYYGVLVCENQIRYKSVTAALRISTVYASASIPVSGVLIIIRTVQVYLKDLKAALNPDTKEEET
jgi:C4-dicarboxylate transporter DctM subunit